MRDSILIGVGAVIVFAGMVCLVAYLVGPAYPVSIGGDQPPLGAIRRAVFCCAEF